MKQVQCAYGHTYDADVDKQCPVCSGKVSSISFGNNGAWQPMGVGETMPINNPNAVGYQPIPETQPVGGFQFDEIGKTEPVDTVSDEKSEESVRPVCGWLVCVKGKKKGKSFECVSGMNTVGRDEDCDIPLTFDSAISGHNANFYGDTDGEQFALAYANGKNPPKVNGKVILNQVDIHDGDVIRLGHSEFIFRAFCGASFRWELDEE
ncbi:MAG: FHA domain-containing protein [Clostridia bacterium]|nr:FHA domain-containing protein [Clostridia bacterium]